MTYECAYNPELNCIEAVMHDAANVDGLIDMLHAIVELCARHESANILVDHSASTANAISMDDVSTLSTLTAASQEVLHMRRCAHVVRENLQLGLVRAWEIMIELNGLTDLESSVFRERDEAVAWLNSGRW